MRPTTTTAPLSRNRTRARSSTILRVRTATALLGLLVVPGWARPAPAQTFWSDRARVSVSLGPQLDTARLREAITLEKYVEPAPLTAEMANAAIPFFDIGGMVRLTGNLGAAVAMSYLSDTGITAVSAEMPHPFFFKRPRAVAGEVPGIQHKELVTHVGAVYMIVSPRIDLALSGGVSFFQVNQDFITDIAFAETYPYDTATFSGSTLARVSASKTGYHASADVTWKRSSLWGIGGLLRFSRARVPFRTVDFDLGTQSAGGLQVGAGLRLAF